jgi:hypothetical protein
MAERKEGSPGGPDAGRRLGIILRGMAEKERGVRLPPGCKLLGVSPHIEFLRNLLAYKVEHEELPPVPTGAKIPRVEPCWQADTFIRWKGIPYEDPPGGDYSSF